MLPYSEHSNFAYREEVCSLSIAAALQGLVKYLRCDKEGGWLCVDG
jgi:hypothetical protein